MLENFQLVSFTSLRPAAVLPLVQAATCTELSRGGTRVLGRLKIVGKAKVPIDDF